MSIYSVDKKGALDAKFIEKTTSRFFFGPLASFLINYTSKFERFSSGKTFPESIEHWIFEKCFTVSVIQLDGSPDVVLCI